MERFKLQFIRKFHLAFAMLMLATLASVWIYNDRVNFYKQSIEQMTMANNALQGYQELFNLVSRELRAMSESVLEGDSRALSEPGLVTSVLREVVSIVRQDIAEEAAFSGNGDASTALEQVLEIERVVEEIIRTSQLIGQALNEGRTDDASNALEQFKNTGFADSFNALIIAAMADQTLEPPSENREASELIQAVAKWAPFLMTGLVVIIFLLNFVLSRRTINSVSALHDGVLALRSGDLSHRIPKLRDKEFQRLGATFNAMAIRLSEQREQLRDTNVQLEVMVDDRTRQLQETNKKLANADLSHRKLLADISHEFRTPLTVIRGEAEIAMRGSDKTRKEYRDSFQRIVKQAVNSTRLVDDLLFMARADAGEPRLKLSSVQIVNMIDSVCQEFAAHAEKKGVKIEHCSIAAGTLVEGDAGRLRQVFAILMDNALKFSDSGGRILIEVLQGGRNLTILFKDEGIGLTEEESELAFKRFYRASTAVEQASGSGIGLAVAKAIVEAHNGTISLSGKPGQGATATVVLPFGREFGILI